MAGATVWAQQVVDRAAVLERGAAIYRKSCASCHGDAGQGVASAYADPLVGDSTAGELTALIEATMPEGEPEKCVGPDAAAVAFYIHEQFYGAAAQVRNRPPRAMLAHLTASQLRQSLADLYSHFAGMAEPTEDRGVYGMYFEGTNQKEEHKKIKRVDPVLQFDFGHAGPGESITKGAFCRTIPDGTKSLSAAPAPSKWTSEAANGFSSIITFSPAIRRSFESRSY
jgi:mono/diheme cytochrome c family protein